MWFMDLALVSDSLGTITLRIIRELGQGATLFEKLRSFDCLYC